MGVDFRPIPAILFVYCSIEMKVCLIWKKSQYLLLEHFEAYLGTMSYGLQGLFHSVPGLTQSCRDAFSNLDAKFFLHFHRILVRLLHASLRNVEVIVQLNPLRQQHFLGLLQFVVDLEDYVSMQNLSVENSKLTNKWFSYREQGLVDRARSQCGKRVEFLLAIRHFE